MLKLKTFIKKTRRGKVLKVVREHYLRDDLGCGVPACEDCSEFLDNDENLKIKQFPLLEDSPKSKCSLFKTSHYLVLDTNIVLNQMDVIEVTAKDGGMTSVIILHTVLEEVRHRSSPIYKRLKDLISGKFDLV